MHVCRPSGTPFWGTAITFQRLQALSQVRCLWPRPWPAPPAGGAGPCWQPLPGDLTFPSAPALLSTASTRAQPGRGTGPERACGGRCRRRWQRGGGDEPAPGPAQGTRAERRRASSRAPSSPLAAAVPQPSRRRARGAPLTGAARSGPAGPFLLLSSNKCCSQSGVSLTRHCCGISSPSDSTICYFEWSLGRSHCSMMSFLYLCLWVEHSLHLSITPITPCRQQQ